MNALEVFGTEGSQSSARGYCYFRCAFTGCGSCDVHIAQYNQGVVAAPLQMHPFEQLTGAGADVPPGFGRPGE
jgi:hypothetical protein